jgi:hypothetical protein
LMQLQDGDVTIDFHRHPGRAPDELTYMPLVDEGTPGCGQSVRHAHGRWASKYAPL